MFRSPPAVRASTKAQRATLSAPDKKPKVQRSLSTSSEPCPKTTTMGDKGGIDPAIVAACVNKYLTGEEILEKLVGRLTEIMTATIERAVKAAMHTVNEELVNLRNALKDMEEKLVDRTDELEQYQRRNNLRIFGVEERKNENTDALVMDLCREKLGLELPNNALCRSHRVGKLPARSAADGRRLHRPIIVRFVSYRDRRAVYGAKKKLKGTGVLIREDLTRRRVEVWKTAVAAHGLRNTWTQDGRVLWLDESGNRGVATSTRDI